MHRNWRVTRGPRQKRVTSCERVARCESADFSGSYASIRGVMHSSIRISAKTQLEKMSEYLAFERAQRLLNHRLGAVESLPREPLQRLSPSWPG